MRTLTVIVLIIIVVLIGWLIYYANQQPSPAPYSTNSPAPTSPTSPTSPGQPGVPVVSVDSNVVTSDTTALVGGNVVPNGVFTNYWFEYGTTASLGSRTSNQSVGAGYTAIGTPGYITGLTPSTTYYFRLVAENQYGQVASSPYTFQTTQGNPAPVGSAPAPKTSAADTISRTAANLNGQVNPDGAATQYWFEYGTTANLGNTTGFASIGSGNSVVSASISLSDLDPATTYYFRLDAQNEFGTVVGSILNFKTNGPAAATAPTVSTGSASSIGTSSVALGGTVNPNGDATEYWFEYSTDSLFGSLLLSTTPQQSIGSGLSNVSVSTTVSGLTPNTNYYFRVVAQNDNGIVRGSSVSFKTK